MINKESSQKRELELYLHLPFCVRKCAYCDFLSAPAGRETQRQYVDAMKKEICSFEGAEQYEVTTLFFGGGTPSLLPAEWIEELLQEIRTVFSGPMCEITMECNPGTVDFEKLLAYRRMGINRLSLGLQSAQNQELKVLGRIHTFEMFLESFALARKAGFNNLNVDLMSALPGQKLQTWEDTLKKVLSLEPEHISAYSLIIEEGTEFADRYGEDAKRREAGEACIELPSEEEERRMYERTLQLLGQAGLFQYEISNYAKPGYECRHNCGYWRRIEYAGFGIGAASLLNEKRIQNTADLTAYRKNPCEGRSCQVLSRKEQMEEFMFLGLRMNQGVSSEQFRSLYSLDIKEVYGEEIESLIQKDLLKQEGDRIFLTARGRDLANYVMSYFI